MEDGRAEIPLNVTVQGDVLVVIYHARSTLGGRLQAKVPTHKCSTHQLLAHSVSLCKASFRIDARNMLMKMDKKFILNFLLFQMASMKMFQIQFHTGFVPRNATTVKFAKYVHNFEKLLTKQDHRHSKPQMSYFLHNNINHNRFSYF